MRADTRAEARRTPSHLRAPYRGADLRDLALTLTLARAD